jgi:putative endonuclease
MPLKKPADRKLWSVYIVKCANGALYTGIAADLDSRLAAHNAGTGAKYTRSFGPVKLAWSARKRGRSAASRLEARLKSLTREEKLALIRSSGNK